MSSATNKIRVSTFVGTGNDRKIVLGYKPKLVEVYGETDGIDYKKSESMATDKARKEIIDGTKTFVSAISLNSDGFTFIAAENVDTKVFHYIAYESRSE